MISGSVLAGVSLRAQTPAGTDDRLEAIESAAAKPVLDVSRLTSPVIIEAVDVLRPSASKYVVRVRSRDGAEGMAVANELQFGFLHPLLQERIVPYLLGKDARDWEALLEGVYLHRGNYKMQGLAFWLPLACVEFAVLDLLGRISGQSVPELLGGYARTEIGLYYANDHRGKTPERSAELIAQLVKETGAKAVKFKVGGRMSRNADFPQGRTDALVPLLRQTLGPEVTLYADSNGSYDVPEAIRIGRLLERHHVAFFEEPVPFDRFGDTKAVADALDIPIAGGEQDSSAYNFAWLLANNGLQIVQPDLFYFGGMIRCIRIARMAAVLGCDCTPHISGTGTGFLYAILFAACVRNTGAHQEFKGIDPDVPFTCATSSLRPARGVVQAPTGPGLGIELDPAWIQGAPLVPRI